MIVYRLHTSRRDQNDGLVEFYATKDEGLAAFKKAKSLGQRAKLEKVDCPTDRKGLAMALSLASMHPSHWELGQDGEPHTVLAREGW